MADYVWALHEFKPVEADEIPFKVGDRIQVIERDDVYQDGWWKGINPEGKTGLFPRTYTTDQRPVPSPPPRPQPTEARSAVAFPDASTASATVLSGIHEGSTSVNGNGTSHSASNGEVDDRERTLSEGEIAMQATLTDVQRAIEQLGRNNDNDGTRSFSFRSSHDEYSERSESGTDAEDEDADGSDWHRSAREKLALRAQQENEQRRKDSGSVPSTPMRLTAPPIDVEVSDESSDEEEEDPRAQDSFKNIRRHSDGVPESSHFKTRYSYIPEEDETEGTVEASGAAPAGRTSLEDRNATVVPSLPSAATTIPTVRHLLPSPESENGYIVPSEDYIVPSPGVQQDDLPTATADRLTFPDVPFVASPDPSPSLSAQTESTEPSPIPPPAPPPVAVVAPPPAARSPPVAVPTPTSAPEPAPASAPVQAPSPVRSPPPPIIPAAAPVLAATNPTPVTTGAVMPGSLNPLSPITPENEPTPVIPAAAAPSIVTAAPSVASSAPSTIKLVPVPIKTDGALPLATRGGIPSPGLPLPSPSVSSSGGSIGFSSGRQQSSTLTPATTPMSFKTASATQHDLSPLAMHEGSRKSPTTHPSEWSLEEVADWLMSKGFDQSVCAKFMEQEITGDVLLELNVNILKDEIGITKWGQRQRIMNAVTELRRPRSFTEFDGHPMPNLATSRSQSLNYGHSHTSSIQSSAQQSYNNSPLGYGGPPFTPAHSTHGIPTSSVNMGPGAFGSFSSADAPIYHMPVPEPPMSAGSVARSGWGIPLPGMVAQASEVTVNMPRPFEPVPEGVSTGPTPSHSADMIGLGLSATTTPPVSRPQSPGASTTASKPSKPRPSNLTVSASDNHLNVTAVGEEEQAPVIGEDRGAVSEPENQDPKAKRRRLFGRSNESASLREKAASLKEVKESSSSRHSKESVPMTPSDGNSKISVGDEVPPVRRSHSKKKSTDDRDRKADRLSLFGSSFNGAIMKKARKPVPRLSSGGLSEKSEKAEKEKDKEKEKEKDHEKHSEKHDDKEKEKEKSEKPEKSEHDWTSLATFTRMRHHSERRASGRPTTSDGNFKKKEEKFGRGSTSPKEKPRDPALLRKRTTSLSDQGARTPSISSQAGGMALKPGKSILEQIGTPDHNGWMRKKSDHYGSWKLRYFVLKGPHLYYLKSNDKSETKIKGYINIIGYKVIADENIDPGRYGFRIVHDSDKTHYFSHDEQIVIREWMKALMKATISRDFTNPVVSSSNIPTIPLTVAQAMNPSPRPPSPTARAATQRAHRRENPNQLSSRDAQILLMGMPQKSPSITGSFQEVERARTESFFTNNTVPSTPSEPATPKKATTPKAAAPPRPSREMRRKATSPPPQDNAVVDDSLIEWANSHLPPSLQIGDTSNSVCGGLALLRIAEDIKGTPSQPPVPDSAFPVGPNDEKLDGLFILFDFLLENDVKMGAVSINDIRQGKKQKIVQILQALRTWEEKRRTASSIGSGSVSGSYMAGPVQFF